MCVILNQQSEILSQNSIVFLAKTFLQPHGALDAQDMMLCKIREGVSGKSSCDQEIEGKGVFFDGRARTALSDFTGVKITHF